MTLRTDSHLSELIGNRLRRYKVMKTNVFDHPFLYCIEVRHLGVIFDAQDFEDLFRGVNEHVADCTHDELLRT
jgi:hypothetical protein